MNINYQAFKLYGVSVQDYFDWCDKKKKSAYLPATKRDFFSRLSSGRLVKDKITGKLLEKRPRRKQSF